MCKKIAVAMIIIVAVTSLFFVSLSGKVESSSTIAARVVYVSHEHGYSTLEDANGGIWAYEGTEFNVGDSVIIAHEGTEFIGISPAKE